MTKGSELKQAILMSGLSKKFIEACLEYFSFGDVGVYPSALEVGDRESSEVLTALVFMPIEEKERIALQLLQEESDRHVDQ